ncbi:2-oxoglutarate-dependent ethylene/succinate-forming enzyme, partial [Trichinella spiralis]
MILCDWALVYLENTTNEETKKWKKDDTQQIGHKAKQNKKRQKINYLSTQFIRKSFNFVYRGYPSSPPIQR